MKCFFLSLLLFFTDKSENDLMMMDSVRKENTRLRSQVKRQQEQLNTCQQEIEESRTMLVQLEQLASQVQQDQSRVEQSVSTYLVYIVDKSPLNSYQAGFQMH